MKSVIERPYPSNFLHRNGEKAKIDFIWGEALSKAPIGITVWQNKDEMQVKIGEHFGVWLTYAEARVQALARA